MSNQTQSYFVKQDYENTISKYIINDYKPVSKRSHSTVLQMRSLIIDFYRFLMFVVVGPIALCSLVFALTHSIPSTIAIAVTSSIIGIICALYTNKPKTINISITEFHTVEINGYTLESHNRRLNRAFQGLSKVSILSLSIYTALIIRYSIMH